MAFRLFDRWMSERRPSRPPTLLHPARNRRNLVGAPERPDCRARSPCDPREWGRAWTGVAAITVPAIGLSSAGAPGKAVNGKRATNVIRELGAPAAYRGHGHDDGRRMPAATFENDWKGSLILRVRVGLPRFRGPPKQLATKRHSSAQRPRNHLPGEPSLGAPIGATNSSDNEPYFP